MCKCSATDGREGAARGQTPRAVLRERCRPRALGKQVAVSGQHQWWHQVTPPGLSPGCTGARSRWGWGGPHVAQQSVCPPEIAHRRPLRFLGKGVTHLRARTCPGPSAGPRAPAGLRSDSPIRHVQKRHGAAQSMSPALGGRSPRLMQETGCGWGAKPSARTCSVPDPQVSPRSEVGNCTGSGWAVRTPSFHVCIKDGAHVPREKGLPLQ